ncbi:MAG: 50S ribosomal protein L19e [Thermoproteota archaeon]|nr:50S ribosomal protein L19e [Candidatus Brockarchaeota archaeon]MBO3762665.1 50S ribosomal protein L19e [Candidatus Brockarchaeota archaeon]MBO3768725.1 50S ribosomal protein L19e [Candidatus Brockarchaeota archaeon]MBO3801047.1 50S ribosomal protein L19e [Candidatus Brockarchaeota archaeon]
MSIKTVKRLAASILKVGTSRIWLDPERLEDLKTTLTRAEVRKLIKDGAIKVRPASTPSRGRKKEVKLKKSKGRRRGYGSRKGKKGARMSKAQSWVAKIRAQRKLLKELRNSGKIDRSTYRVLYLKVKGDAFSSKKNLLDYVNSLIAQGEVNK